MADAEWLAKDYPQLDLYYPWTISVEEAIELAKNCEQSAYAVDKRITNSEGATISVSESQFIYANSLGFMGGYPLSRHSMSCAMIAEQGDSSKQRDYWYCVARDAGDLESPEPVDFFHSTTDARPGFPADLPALCAAAGVRLHRRHTNLHGPLLADEVGACVKPGRTVWFCGPAAWGESLAEHLTTAGLLKPACFHRELFDFR